MSAEAIIFDGAALWLTRWKILKIFARPTGFEPVTPAFGGQHFNFL
jgi:hypothetical protein